MALFDFLRDNWLIGFACLLGMIAVYVLLPRPRRMPVLLGIGVGTAAALLTGFVVARAGAFTLETILFYVFSAVAVVAGTLLVTQQHPARAALSFALVVLATTGLFLIQAGPFLMAATIIVYAGAIIVTFLFVIMLAQQEGLSDADARSREPFLASLTGFLLLAALLYVLKITYKPDLGLWVEQTAAKRERIRELQARGVSLEEKKDLVAELERFCLDYRRWLRNEWRAEDNPSVLRQPKNPPPHASALDKVLDNVQQSFKKGDQLSKLELSELEQAMTRVYEEGLRTQKDPLLGSFQPHFDNPLSEYSGPHPGRGVNQQDGQAIRTDDHGRPHLPAENVKYLGRSLFTDYLLSVELAGMLLLVATIGAIAIAQRRTDAARPAPSANGPPPGRTP
jgi:NADH:ubiquinone oxidoreductase subunit 6 (subunit J)